MEYLHICGLYTNNLLSAKDMAMNKIGEIQLSLSLHSRSEALANNLFINNLIFNDKEVNMK